MANIMLEGEEVNAKVQVLSSAGGLGLDFSTDGGTVIAVVDLSNLNNKVFFCCTVIRN